MNKTRPRKEVYTRKKSDTSWGSVASWYDDHLKHGGDTYQEKVILPNLKRIIGDVKGKHVLDLACGQGFFSHVFAQSGSHVTGVDISKELITLAETAQKKETDPIKKVRFFASPSDDLYMVKDTTQDIVVCVLALQNIEKVNETFQEIKRVLKKQGRCIFVLNHPAFRIPKESAWGYDEHNQTQYRRIDAYLSESKVKMDMTPGSTNNKKFTISFHRPLQYWSKMLSKHMFAIARMEEWESHKTSEKGSRQNAENKARKEIPLFLCIEVVQL